MRAIRRSGPVLALVPAVLLSGCGSSGGSGGSGGKNAPLPRMTRASAQAWAERIAGSVARSAGRTLDTATATPKFRDCVGENDEVAGDGRFDLSYEARVPMPAAEQRGVAAQVRDDLKKQGYRIVSFRDDASKDPAVVVQAYDDRKHASLDIAGYEDPAELDIAVFTPCLLPPGAKQKHL